MLRPKTKRRLLLKRWRLIKKRRWIRCPSLKMKIFYTKMYSVKKTDREEMKVEEEKAKKTSKHHKTDVIKTRPKTRWYKTYVKKEMAIEKSKILGLPSPHQRKGMLLEKPSPICASKVDEEEYSAAVVDSGTAYLTLPFEIYNAVTEIFRNGHYEDFENDKELRELLLKTMKAKISLYMLGVMKRLEMVKMVKKVKVVKMVKIVKMEINGAPPVEFDCSLQDKLPTISFQISRVQYEVVPDHYVSYVEEKLENVLSSFILNKEQFMELASLLARRS